MKLFAILLISILYLNQTTAMEEKDLLNKINKLTDNKLEAEQLFEQLRQEIPVRAHFILQTLSSVNNDASLPEEQGDCGLKLTVEQILKYGAVKANFMAMRLLIPFREVHDYRTRLVLFREFLTFDREDFLCLLPMLSPLQNFYMNIGKLTLCWFEDIYAAFKKCSNKEKASEVLKNINPINRYPKTLIKVLQEN